MLKPNATKCLKTNRIAFQNAILKWFKQVGKNYPWRETTDPYKILVSEIMLQQTTLAAVIANRRFEKFIQQFPDIGTLAKSKEEDVLAAWEGLGYYRRARNLQACAKNIIKDHKGIFPQTHKEILALPGVGQYTAGAIASFAYDQAEAIVDANIARVLSRVLNLNEEVDSTEGLKKLWETASLLVPKSTSKSPRLFNSGLMELGQTLCSQKKPECLSCPINAFCQTRKPETLPKKKPKKKTEHIEEHALFIRRANGDILLAKQTGKRREGLWMLPIRKKEQCTDFPIIDKATYGITHYRVSLYVHDCPPAALIKTVDNSNTLEKWTSPAKINKLPMPSPYRRILTEIIRS